MLSGMVCLYPSPGQVKHFHEVEGFSVTYYSPRGGDADVLMMAGRRQDRQGCHPGSTTNQ